MLCFLKQTNPCYIYTMAKKPHSHLKISICTKTFENMQALMVFLQFYQCVHAKPFTKCWPTFLCWLYVSIYSRHIIHKLFWIYRFPWKFLGSVGFIRPSEKLIHKENSYPPSPLLLISGKEFLYSIGILREST